MFKQYRLMDGDPGATGGAPAAPAASPAPAAPAAAPPAGTANTPAPPADDKPGYWAADWRDRLAAGDTKASQQLQRYASPEDIWKKARALEARLTSGDLKPTLKKDATADEVTEYRKAHGIPDKPDAYELKDIKLDDSDKPLINQVLAAAHAVNAPADVVKAIVSVWPKLKADAAQHMADEDKRLQQSGEDTLRGEWGAEFRRNMGLVHQLLDSTGDGTMKDKLLAGRLSDGTPIGSSPEALKMLLGVALAQNPAGVVVPGGGTNPAGTIKDQLDAISKVRKEKRSEYNKDTAMQEKERSLITAAQKMGLMDGQGNWVKGA